MVDQACCLWWTRPVVLEAWTEVVPPTLQAGLDTVLTGEGPFTVFAPNDDAFADAARALKITKIDLLNLPNLGDILKYHVIAGKVGAPRGSRV